MCAVSIDELILNIVLYISETPVYEQYRCFIASSYTYELSYYTKKEV